MKLLAETTGDFLLSDFGTGEVIQSHRPSVVSRSGFIDARIALGQIIKVGDAPDEATDDDFAAFWAESDGDRDLAVSAFLAKFSPDAVTDQETNVGNSKRKGR